MPKKLRNHSWTTNNNAQSPDPQALTHPELMGVQIQWEFRDNGCCQSTRHYQALAAAVPGHLQTALATKHIALAAAARPAAPNGFISAPDPIFKGPVLDFFWIYQNIPNIQLATESY